MSIFLDSVLNGDKIKNIYIYLNDIGCMDEDEKAFLEDFRRELYAQPISYYPPLNCMSAIPEDIFAHKQTITAISEVLTLAGTNQIEVALQGNIVENEYRLTQAVLGEEDLVIRKRELMPTEQNPHNPYQALVFDMHTHPQKLIPSPVDLVGYHMLSYGSIEKAIWQKNVCVNPAFIIGRASDERQELVCYQFDKDFLPKPQTRGELVDFLRSYYPKLQASLSEARGLSEEAAGLRSLEYFVDVLNSCPGMSAIGKRF